MNNMDMENVFRGVIADVQREMKEGDYLTVPCEDDERPPLGYKKGAFAIVEISRSEPRRRRRRRTPRTYYLYSQRVLPALQTSAFRVI